MQGCMNKILIVVAMLMFSGTFSFAQKKSYSGNVRPIFESYGCLQCHGGSGGGLELGTYNQIFITGTHKPVIVAGDTNSVLIKKIKGTAGFGSRMPQGGPVMESADLNIIIQWVLDGALENPTNVSDPANQTILRAFELRQNYPNPFNPSTQIQYSVPVSGAVKLTLHDVLGNEIMTLVDRAMDAGSYSYQLSAMHLASGIYFYRLQSANNIATKKLTILK